nr:hypothetical protein GCM10017547_22530 [Pseudarthrobacter oxydans]
MHQEFALGRFGLVSGLDLPDATLAYRTYGKLNEAGDNCVLLPSYYTGTHASYEPWIGPGRMLDPERWFVVAVNMFGNGLSTSPSNASPGSGVRIFRMSTSRTTSSHIIACSLLLGSATSAWSRAGPWVPCRRTNGLSGTQKWFTASFLLPGQPGAHRTTSCSWRV